MERKLQPAPSGRRLALLRSATKAPAAGSVPASLQTAAPIPVTQPFLPPLAEFLPYLEQIWKNKWLTNDGPFHRQLEAALCDYLGVPYLSLVANGTLALITALRALDITGDVITTPYSFVATAHALSWNGNRPVFVDIDPVSLNLDPERIEAAITPRTQAILPVHCYGRPCAIEAIEALAARRGLTVIYDAAHAFGVRHGGAGLLNAGDLSVVSFHATKVFNTFEGGAIVSHDPETKRRIDRLKNFGIVDEVTVAAVGINSKMSEVAAAFGLLQLTHIDQILVRRRAIDTRYRSALDGVPGLDCLRETNPDGGNSSYFPILIQPEYPLSRDALYRRLKERSIHARRYFYPLITALPMYRDLPSAARDTLPVARQVADRILCLPIYPGLLESEQERVLDVLLAPLSKTK